jgi:hypothetical protein
LVNTQLIYPAPRPILASLIYTEEVVEVVSDPNFVGIQPDSLLVIFGAPSVLKSLVAWCNVKIERRDYATNI